MLFAFEPNGTTFYELPQRLLIRARLYLQNVWISNLMQLNQSDILRTLFLLSHSYAPRCFVLVCVAC